MHVNSNMTLKDQKHTFNTNCTFIERCSYTTFYFLITPFHIKDHVKTADFLFFVYYYFFFLFTHMAERVFAPLTLILSWTVLGQKRGL